MCYLIAGFIGSVCGFGKDYGIEVQKCFYLKKKILSYLMGFEIFKNSEVRTVANPYECQRCGN